MDEYAQFWMKHWPGSFIYEAARVQDAIDRAKRIGSGAQILVLGSLYLVEAALKTLQDLSTWNIPSV